MKDILIILIRYFFNFVFKKDNYYLNLKNKINNKSFNVKF